MQPDIKSYIARAKELEVAIYKQRQLMEEHKSFLLSKRPIRPIAPSIIKPSFRASEPEKESVSGIVIKFAVMSIVFLILACVMEAIAGFFVFCALVCGGIGIWLYLSKRKKYKDALITYRGQVKVYEMNLSETRRRESRLKAKYDKDLVEYNTQMDICISSEEIAMASHSECLRNLEAALEEHYSMNVLFEKYRNLVAVTTIDEYLQSGRCDALEGGEGAYNLYEMELRQNIVIGQLSAVLKNMEQIKNNQYTLYQELAKANAGVAEIIAEIKELNSTAKLNAYFAYMSAQIAAAPKYIHGHIY